MISIIIVTYNNEKDIASCLASLPFKKSRLDVLCVDNRSRDKTRHAIRSYMMEHPTYPIRLIFNSYNKGYAEAVNQGLKLVKGKWICILGPDTMLQSNTLQILRDKLKSHSDIGIVAPQLIWPDQSIQPSCRRFPKIKDVLIELTGLPRVFPKRFYSRWKMDDFDHISDKFVDQPEATCLFIRRKALNDVGYMDEQFPIFFNDVDWCRRLNHAGWKTLYTPDTQIIHTKGTSVGKIPAIMIWKSHQGFYRYFRKYSRSSLERLLLVLFGLLLICTACIRIAALHLGYVHGAMNPPK